MMKVIKRYCWLLLIVLVSACYEPLEVNTDNIGKVNMPVKLAMPLMDGNLVIHYDSLVNFDELGEGIVKFENNKALISIDTMIDMYDQLSNFLNATDIDLNNIEAFSQRFDMDFDDTGSTVRFEDIKIGNNQEVDTSIVLFFVDSMFRRYNANAVYMNKSQASKISIEGVEVDKEMQLGLDFQIYKIGMSTGKLTIEFESGNFPNINDDSLFVRPSLDFNNGVKDTTLYARLGIPIEDSGNRFPLGVAVSASISLPDFYQDGAPFDTTYIIHQFDTSIVIDLDGLSYERPSGDGVVSVDVKNWITNDTSLIEGATIIPLPDEVKVSLKADSIKLEGAIFNYGRDTIIEGAQELDLDFLSDLPEGLEVEGFSFKTPEIKVKLRSNLGFAARLAVDSLVFTTDQGPENVMREGGLDIEIFQPQNPNGIDDYVVAQEDSLVIDSVESRIGDVDIFDVKGLYLDYALVLNPKDEAHTPGYHNFVYLYDKDKREQMYDVKLFAEARVPIGFRFDNVRYEMTQELSLDSMDLDMVELNESDSLSLSVKMLTRNFPFEFAAQFYFGEANPNGDMVMLDSMFNQEAIIIPGTLDGVLDSTEWSLTLNADRFESLQAMDSVKLKIHFSMDDGDYFEIEKGVNLEIGYDFSVAESSATINIDE